jgi:hypothetical protein
MDNAYKCSFIETFVLHVTIRHGGFPSGVNEMLAVHSKYGDTTNFEVSLLIPKLGGIFLTKTD